MSEHPINLDRRPHPSAADSDIPVVCVCIATCRRPVHLKHTLESIAALRFEKEPTPEIRIIVVENDINQLGRPVIASMRTRVPWPIEYVIESRPGISFARNTLIRLAAEAEAKLIAFIDDDELAEPQWLDELLATLRKYRANAVLGPVLPRFESPPPPWLATAFDRRRHATGSVIGAADFRTGNLLLESRILLEIDGPFDHDFSLIGGSDACLGRDLEKRGQKFFWNDEAIVHETVPDSRANVSWYLQRRFRTGMSLAVIRLKLQGQLQGSASVLFKGIGAIGFGLLSTSKGLMSGRKGLLEGVSIVAFGLGSLYGLFGGRFQEYASVHGTPKNRPQR